jgi:hypothetical protein
MVWHWSRRATRRSNNRPASLRLLPDRQAVSRASSSLPTATIQNQQPTPLARLLRACHASAFGMPRGHGDLERADQAVNGAGPLALGGLLKISPCLSVYIPQSPGRWSGLFLARNRRPRCRVSSPSHRPTNNKGPAHRPTNNKGHTEPRHAGSAGFPFEVLYCRKQTRERASSQPEACRVAE